MSKKLPFLIATALTLGVAISATTVVLAQTDGTTTTREATDDDGFDYGILGLLGLLGLMGLRRRDDVPRSSSNAQIR